ncbi:MAG: LysM peptidoglycan-binding domain-containing protein, partial [Pseudomonadota bacterium]
GQEGTSSIINGTSPTQKDGPKQSAIDKNSLPSESEDQPPSSETTLSNEQELLDSALDLIQASNDFWEQGDLDSAIDALDNAYSILLRVNEEDDAETFQQKDDLRSTIAKRIIEIYASRFTVATGTHKAIPLVMNAHVKHEIESFKGSERDFFLNAYRRSGRYRPAILKVLKEAGLPRELSWLPLIESGYKVRALSTARALGLWQFIATTGYKFGLKRDTWVDERMDPGKATRAAIAYLKELHQIFGDWTTALASYNCGERNVLNRIRTQRINYLDNFWDLYEKLPRETARYVPRFLAVLHIINDPKAHGFDLPPVEEQTESEEVTISKKVHLKTIAERLNIDYETLRDLNAELRQDLTPDDPYPLKVPLGKGDILLAKLGDIPESDIPAWRHVGSSHIIHKVRKGESLYIIAKKYRTSVNAIMAMNGLTKKSLKVGWSLKIPSKRVAFSPKEQIPIPDLAPKKASFEYMVKHGDNLWKLASRYNTTVKDIKSLNKFQSTNLQVGQVVLVPTSIKTATRVKTKSYTVQKGDSPYVIARKYQMDLSEFFRLNNLTPRSTLFPGQNVLVKID